MGRRPIIREAIIKILKVSEFPLEPDVLRQKIAELLVRKKEDVAETNLYSNLKRLIKNGQVEKQIIDGKPCYKLSNSFYLSENKTMIKSIIDLGDTSDFIPRLEKNHPPLTVFVKNLENIKESKRITNFFPANSDDQNWSDPVELIARRMLVTFSDLPFLEKEGIKKLLAYAYWYGANAFIKEFGKGTLKEVMANNEKNIQLEIESARKREVTQWVEPLENLIEIIKITQEIPMQKNLDELLFFLQKQKLEIHKLQKQIFSSTFEDMNAGEKSFNLFLDFHGCALVGLEAAGLVSKNSNLNAKVPMFRYIYNYKEVWNQLIFSIFYRFSFDKELKSINESMEKSLDKIKTYEEYFLALLKIPFRSKIVITYLWGYPEIFSVSNKAFLSHFHQWFSALKKGHLDDRSWIFSEKTTTSLINTLKDVRIGKTPQEDLIDLVPWSINDLYEYHPQGKDVDFWENFLVQIKLRLKKMPNKTEVYRHISAAIDRRY